MISAVIDTNCLILSVPSKNPEHWLYQAFRDKRFEWILSNEILAEYEEQVGLFYSVNTANIVLDILVSSPNVRFVEPFYHWNLMTNDADDNKFVDCAIASNAQCIVTNDKHFKILDTIPFPKVEYMSPELFKGMVYGYI